VARQAGDTDEDEDFALVPAGVVGDGSDDDGTGGP
jgi:hypothetical protein